MSNSLAKSSRLPTLGGTTLFYLAAGISLFGGLARTKIVAAGLGPLGSGVIGQLSTVVAVLSVVSCLGLWNISAREFKIDQARSPGSPLIGTASVIMTVSASSALVAGSLAVLGPFLLGGVGLSDLSIGVPGLVILALASGFSGIAISWWRVTNRPWRNLWVVVVANIASTGMTGLGSVKGHIIWAEFGLIATFLVPSVAFIVLDLFPLRHRLRVKFAVVKSTLQVQIVAGIASLLVTFARTGADLFTRVALISVLGVSANGLVQPYFVYSTVILPQLVSIVLVFAVGHAIVEAERHLIARRVLELIIGLAVLAIIMSISAEPILRFLFSTDFLAGSTALRLGVWAEIARWCAVFVATLLIADGTWKLAVSIVIGGSLLRILLVLVLLPYAGIQAPALAIGIESGLTLAALTLGYKRSLPNAAALGLVGVGLLSIVAFSTGAYIYASQ